MDEFSENTFYYEIIEYSTKNFYSVVKNSRGEVLLPIRFHSFVDVGIKRNYFKDFDFFMKDEHDLVGLKNHLIEKGIMNINQMLIEINKND